MAAETWLLICVLFWSLQSRLAAPQVTAKPCHFGLCQLLKSSAPAVLALRSWLTSFKQAIWHKSQLLVSLCGRATSPKGVIYIPWLLGSLQKYSERKTTCQEDTRFGEHHDQGKQERKITEKSGSSKFVSLGWNFLGGFFWGGLQQKTTKTKLQWEMPPYSCTDFKSRPPNEPAIRILHYAPMTF